MTRPLTSRFRRNFKQKSVVEVQLLGADDLHGPDGRQGRIAEWARIAGSIGQILMLAVVAAGYWFTVRPVFQHQLLQEKAAQLELDIRSKETRLNSLSELVSEAEGQVRQMQARLAAEQTKGEELAVTIRTLEDREQSLTLQISTSEEQLQNKIAKLEEALWQLFVNDLLLQSLPTWFEDMQLSQPNDFSIDTLRIELRSIPDPYRNLVDAVRTMRAAYAGPNEYPDRFFERALAHIESRREYLLCETPDIEALNRSYREDVNGLASEIDDEVEEVVARAREKAASRGNALLVTDEFLDATRSSVEIGKKYGLYSQYRDKIYESMLVCQDRRSTVMNELADLVNS